MLGMSGDDEEQPANNSAANKLAEVRWMVEGRLTK